MNDAFKRAFLIKIIPPGGTSVYRVHFTRRHLAIIGGLVLFVLLGAAGLHSYQLRVAEVRLHEMEALTQTQRDKLSSIDREAEELGNQLKTLQRENQEIRRAIGIDKNAKPSKHAFAAPHERGGPSFAGVARTISALAVASQSQLTDSRRLQKIAMRVLNLRHLAQIARSQLLAAIPSINPAGAEIASGYGYRSSPFREFHKGVDLAANYGDIVRASAVGTVVSAGWDAGGFGNKIDIDHGNGYHTWYAHLSQIHVRAGDRVLKGEPIANVGSTGESTGPHLHYQVMYLGQAINPEPFLTGVPASVMATLPDSGEGHN